jgi:PHD/YefM family antitoxin component YafN of YafNO toxin-antitoxin module
LRDVPWYSALGLAAVVTFESDIVEETTKEGNALMINKRRYERGTMREELYEGAD